MELGGGRTPGRGPDSGANEPDASAEDDDDPDRKVFDGRWEGMNNDGHAVVFEVCDGEVSSFEMPVKVSYGGSSCLGETQVGMGIPISSNEATFSVGVSNAHIGLDVVIKFRAPDFATGSMPEFRNGGLICESPGRFIIGTESRVAGSFTFDAEKTGPTDCRNPKPRPGVEEPSVEEPCEVECGNGECIDESWLCDEVEDCSDGSDEVDCEGLDSGQPPRPCEVRCGDGECIEASWVCDGEADCVNATDERGCVEDGGVSLGDSGFRKPR